MDFPLPGIPVQGYTVTINEDGLSKLALNGTVLGEGTVQLIDGNWFYRPFDPAGFTPTVSSKLVTYQANGATVTHTYTGILSATVVYTYVVSGNDIHVSVHVTNTHATKSLQPGFRSMCFQRQATGGTYINLGFNQSDTQNQGENLSYPGVNVPFSACSISVPSTAGPLINLATWSEEHPTEKFMSLLFNVAQFPGISVGNVFFNRVSPGGSRIYKYAFRFQNSTGWKDLLGGYKTHLRAAFPTIAYEPDARPLVQFASIFESHIRPDNPYGYNDGGTGVFRRFDTLAGCQDYVAKLTGPMVDTNYQGIVMWQPQGIHPRGVQYRPDFNNFPPVTVPNLPTLVNGFRNAGLNIGLLARPNIAVTSADWDHDTAIELDNSSDGTIEDLMWRLDWALGQGFNAFYLDSFVSLEAHMGTLKAIRAKVGPNIHLFTEHSTALSMAISASYIEFTWNNGIVLTQTQQVLRWLYPESIFAARFREPLPPGGYAQLYPAMFDLKLTPWIEDHRAISTAAGSENAILKPLVASRIGTDKRWL